jgi:hypothetical protein
MRRINGAALLLVLGASVALAVDARQEKASTPAQQY